MGVAHRASGSGSRRSCLDDAAFRRAIDDAKASIFLSSVVGRKVKLRRAGSEWKGLCPFHSERTPSFTVVDGGGFAKCFGCGWHGDHIRFLIDAYGVSFAEAFRMLTSSDLPKASPQEMAKEEATYRLANHEKENEARRQWKSGVPIAGTPAETYLRARGIDFLPPDSAARFGVVPLWIDFEEKKKGPERPALICAAVDATGAVVGVQRIFFLNDDPTLGKADKPKRSLGTIKGAAMQLGPAAETIVLCEAPEDGFSIVQEGPGHPVWVPFGTSMMPAVFFPPITRRVIIAGQNNTAGRIAVDKAAIALSERGLLVDFAWPARQFDDWNDQLRAEQRP